MKMWSGIEIDDDLISLFLEKLTLIKGGLANDFLKHLTFNLEDYIEKLEYDVEDEKENVEQLKETIDKLQKEVNSLDAEIEGYVDENREYVRLLKASKCGDMLNQN